MTSISQLPMTSFFHSPWQCVVWFEMLEVYLHEPFSSNSRVLDP